MSTSVTWYPVNIPTDNILYNVLDLYNIIYTLLLSIRYIAERMWIRVINFDVTKADPIKYYALFFEHIKNQNYMS